MTLPVLCCVMLCCISTVNFEQLDARQGSASGCQPQGSEPVLRTIYSFLHRPAAAASQVNHRTRQQRNQICCVDTEIAGRQRLSLSLYTVYRKLRTSLSTRPQTCRHARLKMGAVGYAIIAAKLYSKLQQAEVT